MSHIFLLSTLCLVLIVVATGAISRGNSRGFSGEEVGATLSLAELLQLRERDPPGSFLQMLDGFGDGRLPVGHEGVLLGLAAVKWGLIVDDVDAKSCVPPAQLCQGSVSPVPQSPLQNEKWKCINDRGPYLDSWGEPDHVAVPGAQGPGVA